MSMYYSMIMVPAAPRLRPGPERIATFLHGILEMGAIGEEDRILLRNYHNTSVTFLDNLAGPAPRNPRIELPELVDLESVKKFPEAMQKLTDFDAVIQGTGPARVLPIRGVGGYANGRWKPLNDLIASGVFTDQYGLKVECCQRSILTSTSDLHEETESGREAELFGEPCAIGDRVGLYSNPETLELIEVPNAGCSTFWIAFQLGKWMFPTFREKRIDFVEPSTLQLAEYTFGTKFTEGCSWG